MDPVSGAQSSVARRAFLPLFLDNPGHAGIVAAGPRPQAGSPSGGDRDAPAVAQGASLTPGRRRCQHPLGTRTAYGLGMTSAPWSGPASPNPTAHGRVLVTGAAGTIGGFLRVGLRRPGRVLRLTDIVPIEDGDEEIGYADLTDAAAVAEACTGVDAIVHLGGIGTEAPLDDLMRVNVSGTANVLEGARMAGVSRVVLASSSHAAGFYTRADVPPGADGLPDGLPPRPDSLYGWSKAAAEALGALYHDRFGIDVIALRIGTCAVRPVHARGLSTWLSPDDAARLVEACLSAPDPGFGVVWGISANTRRWWSLAGACRLGYRPRDDAEVFADEVADADAREDYVGGVFRDRPLGQWW